MEVESELEKARVLFKDGNRDKARNVLIKAIQIDSRNPVLWFGLSFCVEDPQQKRDCLEKVLLLSPDHPKAKTVLEQLLIGAEEIKDTSVFLANEYQIRDDSIKVNILPSTESQLTPTEKDQGQQLGHGIIDNIEDGQTQKRLLKKAGESTFRLAKKWRKIGIIFGIITEILLLTIFVLIILSKSTFRNLNLILPLLLGAIIIFIVGIVIINKYGDKWDKFKFGAKAEELIGEILSNLPQEYQVLNDIQLGYGNVDHFVIGKNGCMYMIETKSHRGKVTIENDQIRVNNKHTEKDFIKQAQRNTYDMRDEIASILGVNLNVTPILVFTNAYVPYKANIKGVFIMNKKTLLKFINSGKEQQNREIIWEKRALIQEFLNRPRW